jgi:hypothetical protein
MNTSLVRIGWLVLALASATTAQAQLAPPIDPNLSCSIPVVDVDDPVVVYGDQPGSGFSLNVWGEHASAPTVTDNPYQGTNALHMHFVELWDGIEFQSTTAYDSSTVGGIRVAVRGNQSGGNIRIYLLTDTWEKLGFDVPLFDYVVRGAVLEDWQVAYVPIADLIGAQSALIGGLGIQSEFAAELWIDDVQILPTEPVGLYTLFSDHLGDAELIQWGLSFSTDRDAFSGEQSIRALSAYGGSGLLFHLPEVMNSNSYGALTFAVKSDISNLVITPYLETPAGVVNTHLNVADYVHGGITDEWKVVWIPMRDLTGPMTAAIVNLYLEFNQPGVVWLDEVKVREEFKMPLPGGKSWLLITETGDTGCYGSSPPTASHIDSNYFSLDFDDRSAVDVEESNVPILASASGRVVFAGSGQYNGTYVIINHDYEKVENQGTGLETFGIRYIKPYLK